MRLITFNNFSANIIPSLEIIPSENFEIPSQYETENPVQNAKNKFKNYPRIKMITSKINLSKIFSFCPVSHK